MEFRLTYEGLLPSSGNNPHATDKHRIRKHFHLQLKELWQRHPILKGLMYPPILPPMPQVGIGSPLTKQIPFQRVSRIEYLANDFERAGYRWVPLVTQNLSLWCGLDILYLRPGEPGRVVQSGDIDGRVKTLFDALKMPQGKQDLGDFKDKPVPSDENPFYCLLQDDCLISQASIETDRLLEFIPGGIPHDDDARVTITVKLRPLNFNWENIVLL